MKTILIATDFSSAAFNAANYGADMALSINAGLLLLHVYQLPANYSEIPVPATEEEVLENAKKEMNELKDKLVKRTGGKLNIVTEVRTGIFFFKELRTICEDIEPYAVVMGSQGTTATERLFFGGHSVYAMKHLMWPLITVPPEANFLSIKKIGLACDFDHVVETTPIDEIKKLVNDFNAKVHVLYTNKKEVLDPEIVFESGLLEEILAPLMPNYHFITNENIDEGITNFAEENHIDLLIVLPKRHGLLDKVIHRSHTKQLVLHSHIPVMALHS